MLEKHGSTKADKETTQVDRPIPHSGNHPPEGWRRHQWHGREVRRQSGDGYRLDDGSDCPCRPVRAGFGPQLTLAYDSASGNGPYGFGWSLSLPGVTHKTDKGLPQYRDQEESDVYILSGAEDLAPSLETVNEEWRRVPAKRRTIAGIDYSVQQYRPTIGRLFARIERWTNQATGQSHWRSISRDNITTLYGKRPDNRVADPPTPAAPSIG